MRVVVASDIVDLHMGSLKKTVKLISTALLKEEEVRGERTKSGAEIMTSQDGCRCEL